MVQLKTPRALSRIPRRAWRWFFRIAIIAFFFPIFLQWLLGYVVARDARLLPPQLQNAKNVMLVTAHPDDECLFFGPSVLAVLDRPNGPKGGLLVMSTGNNYGLGELRKKELLGSCTALGIDPSRCVALDKPELQDNPTVWWDTDLIESIVAEYVAKWDVDAIISFDSGGVSGHINHRAVSAAVSHYAATAPKAPVAYLLTTTMLLRKYTSLGDLPLTSLPFTWRIFEALGFPSATADESYSGRALVANSVGRYSKTRAAFRHHDSQFSWDRHLYLILSRYVWYNDLVKVPRATAA